MVKIFFAATILGLALVPLAWSDDVRPESQIEAEAAAVEEPEALGAGEDPTLEGALRERALELQRLLAQTRRHVRIEVAPYYQRLPRSWNCPAGRVGRAQVASGTAGEGDLCDFGRRLAEMPPCLSPHDCEALHLWNEEIGPPSVQQVRPPADEPNATAEDDPPSQD